MRIGNIFVERFQAHRQSQPFRLMVCNAECSKNNVKPTRTESFEQTICFLLTALHLAFVNKKGIKTTILCIVNMGIHLTCCECDNNKNLLVNGRQLQLVNAQAAITHKRFDCRPT